MTEKIGVVLAAGLGKRMNSERHKVVHEVCGKPMILHILDEMAAALFDRVFLVVGKLEEQVRAVVGDRVEYIVQAEQLGTGHALMQVTPYLPDDGVVAVLYGDSPLVPGKEVVRLIEQAVSTKSAAVLTAVVDEPYGYGRIVRNADGRVERIVEEKDASSEERAIREVNSGIYAFHCGPLKSALEKLTRDNAQREYLLTDCVIHLQTAGERVTPIIAEDADVIANVNDRLQLAAVESKLRRRLLENHMRQGVTILDPESTYVHADVRIGRDTLLLPGTHLEGHTVIGERCIIGPNARLAHAKVGSDTTVEYSVVMESAIDDQVHVGPFAFVRPGSRIGSGVKIGDFVEIKNSSIGDGTKISHLSYVGDSDVGSGANIGCGVVTVNYDGSRKHRTVIGDGSFVGSNVNLVAPVKVGHGAYVATGSTITDDIPDDAFAIARERQTTKKEYARALKEKLRDKSNA